MFESVGLGLRAQFLVFLVQRGTDGQKKNLMEKIPKKGTHVPLLHPCTERMARPISKKKITVRCSHTFLIVFEYLGLGLRAQFLVFLVHRGTDRQTDRQTDK